MISQSPGPQVFLAYSSTRLQPGTIQGENQYSSFIITQTWLLWQSDARPRILAIKITDDIKLTLLGVIQVKQRTWACDRRSPHETAPPKTFFTSTGKGILTIKGCPSIESGISWQGADKLER